MNYHRYFSRASRPVETCVVGAGGFGRSFLAQGFRVPLMRARVAVDLDAAAAAAGLASVGIDRDRIRECHSPAEAREAWDAGHFIAAGDLADVVDLPLDVVVEATGHPEAGARHAALAVEAGKHVALVSKEVDSVVGPGLAHEAAKRGRVVTPVDGDQPSLLIGLVTWAEVLGFEIIAAGKSSEYDFVFDPAAGTITSNGRTVPAPDFAATWELGDRDAREFVAARSAAAAALPQRTVPDQCEMAVVANAIEFGADRPDFHAPIARISEVPSLFSLIEDGGILTSPKILDVFHCLRGPGEISFAGGVFVVVRCHHGPTWDMLAEKGHVVSRNGATAMLYLPRHVLGLEAATSVLEAALLGVSSGAESPKPHLDLIAVADADLKAGTVMTASGHHHSIENVSSALVPAAPLAPDTPVSFYLAANRTLARDVAKGRPILLADIAVDEGSALLALRRKQDSIFFSEAGRRP
jgi:predicted homoserine dehydrogenase-like protein